jgi:hypothetical protein
MRIFVTISIFISIFFYVGCKNESGVDDDKNFVKLNFAASYSWTATKMHPAVGSLPSCSGDSCVAVYSKGNINSQNYVSAAIASQDMKVKFQVTSVDGGNTYKVFLNDNGTLYTCSNIGSSTIFTSAIEPAESGSPNSGFAVGEFNYTDICGSGITISGPVTASIY